MSGGRARTRPVSKAEARQFMGQAEEYLETATMALDLELYNAAAGNAIHAGINAADVVLASRLGLRAAGQDHKQTLALLETVQPNGKEAERRLRRLLDNKTRIEYDPLPTSASDARQAVERAQQLVAMARAVLTPEAKVDDAPSAG
jgi:HEPN domain